MLRHSKSEKDILEATSKAWVDGLTAENPRARSAESAREQVSLIVSSRNRPQMLFEAVQSILKGSEVPAEIIIVDQSETANPDLAALQTDRACEVHYLWEQSVGLCRANNIGIAAAHYDVLVFTHDDILASPTWFSTLVRSFRKAGERAVVTGRVLATEPEAPGNFAPTLKGDTQPAVYYGRVGFDVLKSFNLIIHRSALENIGNFDIRLGPGTRFPGAEDSDLGFRLLEAGYRIIYDPEALLFHRAWRADRDYLPLRWNYAIAQGAFYSKHLKRRDLYMLWRMIADFKHRMRRFPRRFYYERGRALGDPLFIIGNIVGAARWLRTRHRRVNLQTTDSI
jgi:GT2 family glycosyltransferase